MQLNAGDRKLHAHHHVLVGEPVLHMEPALTMVYLLVGELDWLDLHGGAGDYVRNMGRQPG